MRWRIVGSCVRGSGHEKNGQPCQDAQSYDQLPGGLFVTAVADGAGSAKLADVGADLAAKKAVEFIGERVRGGPVPAGDEWKKLLAEAMEQAREAINTEASRRVTKPSEFACTLILLVGGPDFMAAAQVGDGAVVVDCGNDELLTLTRPRAGEYINETTFLVSENAVETAQSAMWNGRAASVAVFSDGLQSLALKLPQATPHTPFFKPLFKFISEAGDLIEAKKKLESFLKSPRIAERTDDDLTLLLAAPYPEE